MRVKVDQHKCTGCLLCEITCSLVHGGQVRREASAIQVHLSYLDHGHHRPMVCRQCKKMQCLKSQGKDADDARRKAFIWEGDAQVLEDCAFNALVAIDGKLIHCNLCGGDPQCVKSCPTGALALSDAA